MESIRLRHLKSKTKTERRYPAKERSQPNNPNCFFGGAAAKVFYYLYIQNFSGFTHHKRYHHGTIQTLPLRLGGVA